MKHTEYFHSTSRNMVFGKIRAKTPLEEMQDVRVMIQQTYDNVNDAHQTMNMQRMDKAKTSASNTLGAIQRVWTKIRAIYEDAIRRGVLDSIPIEKFRLVYNKVSKAHDHIHSAIESEMDSVKEDKLSEAMTSLLDIQGFWNDMYTTMDGWFTRRHNEELREEGEMNHAAMGNMNRAEMGNMDRDVDRVERLLGGRRSRRARRTRRKRTQIHRKTHRKTRR